MKQTVDRKRAASGERDEEAGMPLASPQSLLEALRAPSTKQHSSEPIQEPVVAITKAATLYMPPMGYLTDLMEEHPMNWVEGMHHALQDDHEILVAYGRSAPDCKLAMSIDVIKASCLTKDPMGITELIQPMLRMHPMVHQATIIRKHLFDSPAVIEVGFYSRQIGKIPTTYLGKTKLYFPRPYLGMRFYVDFTKFR